MDATDTYMTLATASGFTAFALFEETSLLWTPAVLILFATYCIVMAVRQLDRPKSKRR